MPQPSNSARPVHDQSYEHLSRQLHQQVVQQETPADPVARVPRHAPSNGAGQGSSKDASQPGTTMAGVSMDTEPTKKRKLGGLQPGGASHKLMRPAAPAPGAAAQAARQHQQPLQRSGSGQRPQLLASNQYGSRSSAQGDLPASQRVESLHGAHRSATSMQGAGRDILQHAEEGLRSAPSAHSLGQSQLSGREDSLGPTSSQPDSQGGVKKPKLIVKWRSRKL